jgi:hypothetical protein
LIYKSRSTFSYFHQMLSCCLTCPVRIIVLFIIPHAYTLFFKSRAVVGRDSVVGIATICKVDGPGSESLWGARFSTPVQIGRGAHPAFYTMVTGSFLGVKRPGRGVDHPPPSSAEVKERLELYLSSLSWPS